MKAIPADALLEGKEVDLCMFVDSDHAGNNQSRRCRTRFMMYMNMSLSTWYSRKQSTIKISVCCHEGWSGHIACHPIKVEDHGYPDIWSQMCLWI